MVVRIPVPSDPSCPCHDDRSFRLIPGTNSPERERLWQRIRKENLQKPYRCLTTTLQDCKVLTEARAGKWVKTLYLRALAGSPLAFLLQCIPGKRSPRILRQRTSGATKRQQNKRQLDDHSVGTQTAGSPHPDSNGRTSPEPKPCHTTVIPMAHSSLLGG